MTKGKKNTPIIKVCCGSKCKKNKSGKLAKALEKEIATAGLADKVQIKKCDCLGKCKACPVVGFSKGALCFEGVKPKDASKMVEKIMASL